MSEFAIRRSEERGHFDHGWLDTRHTFSFASYHDPAFMGFRSLRVINEDRVQPGEGFGTHSHHDMEILTWVLEGALEHRDSIGTGSIIRPGEIQRMSAGTGVRHSEFNASDSEPVHFLQIWILPNARDLEPSYEQKSFDESSLSGALRPIATPDGDGGAVLVHQDVTLLIARVASGQRVQHSLDPSRHAWIQIARGAASIDGQRLGEGDGAGLSGVSSIEIVAVEPAEVLLFDLA